jgi:hypothetical protein
LGSNSDLDADTDVRSDDVVVAVRRSRFVEHLGHESGDDEEGSVMQGGGRIGFAVDSAVGLLEGGGEEMVERAEQDEGEGVIRKEGKRRWKKILKKVVRMLCSRRKAQN